MKPSNTKHSGLAITFEVLDPNDLAILGDIVKGYRKWPVGARAQLPLTLDKVNFLAHLAGVEPITQEEPSTEELPPAPAPEGPDTVRDVPLGVSMTLGEVVIATTMLHLAGAHSRAQQVSDVISTALQMTQE